MHLSAISKRLILVISICAVVFIAVCAIYYRSFEFLPFAIGVLCGSALNVFKVFILERVVDKALTLEKDNAGNYIRIQYFLRFVLTGVLLFAAVKIPFISLWGAAAGILTLQIAAWSINFFPVSIENESNKM